MIEYNENWGVNVPNEVQDIISRFLRKGEEFYDKGYNITLAFPGVDSMKKMALIYDEDPEYYDNLIIEKNLRMDNYKEKKSKKSHNKQSNAGYVGNGYNGGYVTNNEYDYDDEDVYYEKPKKKHKKHKKGSYNEQLMDEIENKVKYSNAYDDEPYVPHRDPDMMKAFNIEEDDTPDFIRDARDADISDLLSYNRSFDKKDVNDEEDDDDDEGILDHLDLDSLKYILDDDNDYGDDEDDDEDDDDDFDDDDEDEDDEDEDYDLAEAKRRYMESLTKPKKEEKKESKPEVKAKPEAKKPSYTFATKSVKVAPKPKEEVPDPEKVTPEPKEETPKAPEKPEPRKHPESPSEEEVQAYIQKRVAEKRATFKDASISIDNGKEVITTTPLSDLGWELNAETNEIKKVEKLRTFNIIAEKEVEKLVVTEGLDPSTYDIRNTKKVPFYTDELDEDDDVDEMIDTLKMAIVASTMPAAIYKWDEFINENELETGYKFTNVKDSNYDQDKYFFLCTDDKCAEKYVCAYKLEDNAFKNLEDYSKEFFGINDEKAINRSLLYVALDRFIYNRLNYFDELDCGKYYDSPLNKKDAFYEDFVNSLDENGIVADKYCTDDDGVYMESLNDLIEDNAYACGMFSGQYADDDDDDEDFDETEATTTNSAGIKTLNASTIAHSQSKKFAGLDDDDEDDDDDYDEDDDDLEDDEDENGNPEPDSSSDDSKEDKVVKPVVVKRPINNNQSNTTVKKEPAKVETIEPEVVNNNDITIEEFDSGDDLVIKTTKEDTKEDDDEEEEWGVIKTIHKKVS